MEHATFLVRYKVKLNYLLSFLLDLNFLDLKMDFSFKIPHCEKHLRKLQFYTVFQIILSRICISFH